MAVKVVIHRKVPAERKEALVPLLDRLRTFAVTQPGYISGDTLVRMDDPEEYLVISTWDAVEDWNQWLADPRRIKVQGEIDNLLQQKTFYQVYGYG